MFAIRRRGPGEFRDPEPSSVSVRQMALKAGREGVNHGVSRTEHARLGGHTPPLGRPMEAQSAAHRVSRTKPQARRFGVRGLSH